MATATDCLIRFIQHVHECRHALTASRGDVCADAPKRTVAGSAEIH